MINITLKIITLIEDYLKKIGILTAGGDCPGLNAIIRSVVISANLINMEVIGFLNGFAGLNENQYRNLSPRDVEDIIDRGGSILGCSGKNPFIEENKKNCLENFKNLNLEGVIVIGGNSSMGTAFLAHKEGINVIGIPKTIDNDVFGTDITVGFDTAVQIATEAIDRLKTTAQSHDRIMVVETMGRDVGWIAVASGIAGGADLIITPEKAIDPDKLVKSVKRINKNSGNNSNVIVIGEGAKFINDQEQTITSRPDGSKRLGGIGNRLAEFISDQTGFETRVSVIGHLQRGGTPTTRDRLLASRFGVFATKSLSKGEGGFMVADKGRTIIKQPLKLVANKIKKVDPQLLETARSLETIAF
tara:strand:+ start:516 stop:1592 length:1077 start_codon:yes stop_codon:yes gene_type:complete